MKIFKADFLISNLGLPKFAVEHNMFNPILAVRYKIHEIIFFYEGVFYKTCCTTDLGNKIKTVKARWQKIGNIKCYPVELKISRDWVDINPELSIKTTIKKEKTNEL